ncbi:hypothetical protein R5W24_005326 [Gemmata sp. JC717]|uniref:hypothetical protein n=1 Tax=Gemmata algarum TaxID=2975278 RepID=UPI0021BBB1E5|nr:hypothetical protein [Gemmata algarum]MDY3556163.1 hypothetical protein [Gemmata algarum]
MICAFCSTHVDDRDEAVEADWWPDFYAGEVNYEGPVCPACTGQFLVTGDHGEMELKPGAEVPPLAIPLQRHPNLKHEPTAGEFPASVMYRGQRYHRTGKLGTRVSDGVRTAEYEADDASRVWLGTDGRVIPD